MAASSFGTVTVATTATLILEANAERKEFSLNNTDFDRIVYLGQDESVTTSNGFPLTEGGFRDSYKGAIGNWLGPVYGIVASSTADVRFWETAGR